LHLRRSHDTRVDQLVNVEAGLYLTANLDVRCPFSTCSTTMATILRIFMNLGCRARPRRSRTFTFTPSSLEPSGLPRLGGSERAIVSMPLRGSIC